MSETMRTRVANLGITLDIANGPNATRDDDGWEHYAYTVTLKRGTDTLSVPWRQGLGVTSDPDAATVLDALASDASGYENAQSFEDWASEYGFNADSRKDERIYRQVGEQTEALKAFLGEAYGDVLWNTERL